MSAIYHAFNLKERFRFLRLSSVMWYFLVGWVKIQLQSNDVNKMCGYLADSSYAQNRELYSSEKVSYTIMVDNVRISF